MRFRAYFFLERKKMAHSNSLKETRILIENFFETKTELGTKKNIHCWLGLSTIPFEFIEPYSACVKSYSRLNRIFDKL